MIKFYNSEDNSGSNIKEILEVKTKFEQTVDVSAHSGAHLSLAIATNNGSLCILQSAPAKFVQPLAPKFTEIEDNIIYVEKENEFDNAISSDEETPESQLGGTTQASLICPLTKQ